MEREKRYLNEKETEEFLKITVHDVNMDLMQEYFANTKKRQAKYLPNDAFKLPRGKLYNDTSTITTVGRYIFNLFVLQDVILSKIGYINYPLDKKGISKMEGLMSQLLLDDKLLPHDFIDYLDRVDTLSYGCTSFLGASISSDLLIPLDSVMKRKSELAIQYKKEIEANDPIAMSKMENELLAIADIELNKLPEYEIYKSGATKGGIGNTYKNIAIMQGAIDDVDKPGQFQVSLDNLHNGISKEDYYKFADMAVKGSYDRAVSTQVGGLTSNYTYTLKYNMSTLNRINY